MQEDTRRFVYTLGTSTRSMDEFLEILNARGITRVCDVRSFPSSTRYPHFSKPSLADSLGRAGIDYTWLGERLGGYRKGGYDAYMKSSDFREGIEELEVLASEKPTAIVCAELLPWRCHRRFIAGALTGRDWEVIHVLDLSRDWVPPDSRGTMPLFED